MYLQTANGQCGVNHYIYLKGNYSGYNGQTLHVITGSALANNTFIGWEVNMFYGSTIWKEHILAFSRKNTNNKPGFGPWARSLLTPLTLMAGLFQATIYRRTPDRKSGV